MDNKGKEQKPRTPGIVSLPTSLTRRSRGRGLCICVLRLVFTAAPLNAVVRLRTKKRCAIGKSLFQVLAFFKLMRDQK